MVKKTAAQEKRQAEAVAAVSGGGVTPKPAVAPAAMAAYSWAQNIVKLNRAIAWAREGTKGLKGDELEAAVKEHYILLGGAVTDEPQAARRGKKADVVNLAEDDGSADDVEDDE